jgi:hypothetical protein
VCCERECAGTCEVCGTSGACQAKLAGPDQGTCDSATIRGTCTAAPCECVSGTCAPGAGTPCTAGSPCSNCVDGYCCDTPCAADCMGCSSALTGTASGTCAPIAANTDPLGDCSGATTCDGAGNCHDDPPGTPCSSAGTCDSGFCVDGVCCTTACTERCYACDAASNTGVASGSCGAIDLGFDPADECAGALTCSGAGRCAVAPEFQNCTADSQCASGLCCGGKCRLGWQLIGPSPGVPLLDVWGSGASNVYAVGQAGTILHFDGDTWTQVGAGLTTKTIFGVSGFGTSQVVAMSDVIVRFNGSQWTVLQPEALSFSAVLATDAQTFVIAGEGVRRWSAGSWTTIGSVQNVSWLTAWPRNGDTLLGGYQVPTTVGLVPQWGAISWLGATEDLWTGRVVASGTALSATADMVVQRFSTTSLQYKVFRLDGTVATEELSLAGAVDVSSSGGFFVAVGAGAWWNEGSGLRSAAVPEALRAVVAVGECEAFAVGAAGVYKF